MSLAGFQDAWTALLWDAEQRALWTETETCPTADLTAAEKTAIQALDANHIQTMAGISGYGRQQMFEKVLPPTIRYLIGPERCYHLTYQYALCFPAQKLYPTSQSLPHLLAWLDATLTEQGILPQHWADVVAYETVVAQLRFYERPSPYQQPGCKLSARAGLFTAGPVFQTLIKTLQAGENTADFSSTPRMGYLVFKDSESVHIEQLHWAVYLALCACDGHCSWEDALVPLVHRYPELRSQAATLLKWEAYWIKKGLLLSPSSLD